MENNIQRTRSSEKGQGNEKVKNRNLTNKIQYYTSWLNRLMLLSKGRFGKPFR